MNKYLRLTEAPRLMFQDPLCDACSIEVESTGDGWECPTCGTAWDYNDGDDAVGTLYEEWSGEPAEGPESTNEAAYLISFKLRREQRGW
jgi:hypothetical protein